MPIPKPVQKRMMALKKMDDRDLEKEIGNFLQWMKLCMATSVYLNAKKERGDKPNLPLLTLILKRLKTQDVSAIAMWNSFVVGSHTYQATDTLVNKLKNDPMTPDKIHGYSESIVSVADKVKINADFDGRASGMISPLKKVMNCISNETPSLNALAQDVNRGMKKVHGFIGVMASEIGEVTQEEQLLTDIESAMSTAEKIKDVNVQIANGSGDVEELVQEKKKLVQEVVAQAELSSDKSAVISAVGSKIGGGKNGRRSQTAIERNLSPDQEEAMLLSGKGIIAAGAGSGKTRVLASKIVYLLKEKGVPSSQIMACSFTRKSAVELKERVENFGGDLSMNDQGFGTTHSISRKILSRIEPSYFAERSSAEDDILLREAILQVATGREDGGDNSAPAPVGYFQEQISYAQDPNDLLLEIIVSKAISGARNSQRQFGTKPWMTDDFALFEPLMGKRMEDLSASEKSSINAWLTKQSVFTNKDGTVQRRPSRGMKLVQRLKGDGVLPSSFTKFASIRVASEDLNLDVEQTQAEREMEMQTKESERKTTPANQWFNLGRQPVALNKMTKEQSPISPNQLGLYITNKKAELISCTEAWFEEQSDLALCYCAYQWLLDNGMPFKKRTSEIDEQGNLIETETIEWSKQKSYDHDDYMIRAVQAMVNNPDALKEIQDQYKYIMVDEAQDLNRLQHVFFGLVSGSIDPQTMMEKPDMSAEDYILIGDDKQAIYEFRGADPNTFIEKSDANGGQFKTKLLKMNYRSGGEIVESANRLMKHNAKQIPMACDYNPERGQGAISSQSFETSMEGAFQSMATIKEDLVVEPLDGWEKDYPKYGVACRTNAEVGEYVLACIVNDVPFSCKPGLNPFKTKTYKALFSLLDIASDDTKARFRSMYSAFKYFNFGLDGKFIGFLKAQARRKKGENALTYLLNSDNPVVYTAPSHKFRNEKFVVPYRDFLNAIRRIVVSGGSLEEILQLKDINGNTVESVIIALQKNENSKQKIKEVAQRERGFDDKSEEEEKEDTMTPLKIISKIVAQKGNLGEAIDFLTNLRDKDAVLSQEEIEGRNKTVVLDTCHGWKGLEAVKVFVPMNAGTFPPSDSSEEELESERRLAYVALTRGRDNVQVITSKTDHKGKEAMPSQFISEACIMPMATSSSQVDPTIEIFKQGTQEIIALSILSDDLTDSEFDRLYGF